MKLERLLLEKKAAILKRWFDLIVETYPTETATFLKKQKNRFDNPVGYTIFQEIGNLFDELLQGINSDRVSPFLYNIMRIRAVQDFSPSQAIAFVFALKKVIRHELSKEIRQDGISEELVVLESRIDELALLSFEIYMKCREKIYELKANEVRSRTFKLLQKANLICEIEEKESGLEDSNIDNLYETR